MTPSSFSFSSVFFRLPPLLSLLLIFTILFYALYLSLHLLKLIIRFHATILNKRNHSNRTQLLNSIQSTDSDHSRRLVIGFFHPYCNAGGGGERVLWTAIASHQRSNPNVICAIYSGDTSVSKSDIILNVKRRFAISLDPNTILLVPLTKRYLVESSTWPRFTLVGQSIGSILLGYEALSKLIPDIYIDTMGYPFTFPVVRLLSQAPIGAYIHYPTISTDMLARVSSRLPAHNNSPTISNSLLLSYAKLFYYMLFAESYAACLRLVDSMMANSSWTKAHLDGLLKRPNEPDPSPPLDSPAPPSGLRRRARSPVPTRSSRSHASTATVVYPPCDVASVASLPLTPRAKVVLSIAQFRPEKDHVVQLDAFAIFLGRLSASQRPLYKLILAGSCRDESDERRVSELQELCRVKGIEAAVEFKVNLDWEGLSGLLGEALVGLSTMVDEHFGISIVEFMAAGLVPLVHRSGGPLLDIVVPHQNYKTGLHASGAEEYADRLTEIFLETDDSTLLAMRRCARALAVEKFNIEQFERGWMERFLVLEGLLGAQR